MNHINKKILVLDCQTTGMHPNTGFMVQLGWCIYDTFAEGPPIIEKRILKLPESIQIPPKITTLLRMTPEELAQALPPDEVLAELQNAISGLGERPMVLIHYAQFELSFLKHYFSCYLNKMSLEFTTLCTQKLAKKVFANLPSYNLKALAGYFHFNTQPKNEVISHIETTLNIWIKIKKELVHSGFIQFDALIAWMNDKNKNDKQTSYLYNMDRLARLELPEKPGIYKMLAHDGRVLYVGKATSLKSRVNSYFRGFKNRDKRKLEMLAQVWRIDAIECDTPLEAALLESDEIKQLNPHYNILLKGEFRELLFYNRDYTQFASQHSELFCEGPFRPMSALQSLIELHNCFLCNTLFHFPDASVSPSMLREAWMLFGEQHNIVSSVLNILNPRALLVCAYRLLRAFEKTQGPYSFESWWMQQKKDNPQNDEPGPEYWAHKIWRLFIRAAETLRKSKQIWRLSKSQILILSTQKPINLTGSSRAPHTRVFDIALYDKCSILLSAKRNRLITSSLI